jgi:hypothetical protein
MKNYIEYLKEMANRYDPEHASNPYHNTLLKYGYTYSHSSPLTLNNGDSRTNHTYKSDNNRNVGVHRNEYGRYKWSFDKAGSQ